MVIVFVGSVFPAFPLRKYRDFREQQGFLSLSRVQTECKATETDSIVCVLSGILQ